MRLVPSLVGCVFAVSLFCLSGIAPAQAEEKPLPEELGKDCIKRPLR